MRVLFLLITFFLSITIVSAQTVIGLARVNYDEETFNFKVGVDTGATLHISKQGLNDSGEVYHETAIELQPTSSDADYNYYTYTLSIYEDSNYNQWIIEDRITKFESTDEHINSLQSPDITYLNLSNSNSGGEITLTSQALRYVDVSNSNVGYIKINAESLQYLNASHCLLSRIDFVNDYINPNAEYHLEYNTLPISQLVSTPNTIYSPQYKTTIDVFGAKVDLSKHYQSRNKVISKFVWKLTDGTVLREGVDYTQEQGVFTFIKNQNLYAYCEITNAEYPSLKGFIKGNPNIVENGYLTTKVNITYDGVAMRVGSGNLTFRTKVDASDVVIKYKEQSIVPTLVSNDGVYKTYQYNHSTDYYYRDDEMIFLSGNLGKYLEVSDQNVYFLQNRSSTLEEIEASNTMFGCSENRFEGISTYLKKVVLKNYGQKYGCGSGGADITLNEGLEYIDLSGTYAREVYPPKSTKYLDISMSSNAYSQLSSIYIKGTNIETLKMSGIYSWLYNINIEDNPNLKNLDLTLAESVDNYGDFIIRNNSSLETVRLANITYGASVFSIDNNRSLKEVYISTSSWYDSSARYYIGDNEVLSKVDFTEARGFKEGLESESSSIKVSNNPNLTQVLFPKSGFSVEILNLNNNKLSTLDLSGLNTLKALSINRNFFTSVPIVKENHPYLSYLDVGYNQMDIQSLPDFDTEIQGDIYTAAQPRFKPKKLVYNATESIDLSSQLISKGFTGREQNTTYLWRTACGTLLSEGRDYIINSGVTQFLKYPGDKVYCEMSTPSYPELTSYDGETKLDIKSVDSVYRTVDITITEELTACSDVGVIKLLGGRLTGCAKKGRKYFTIGEPTTALYKTIKNGTIVYYKGELYTKEKDEVFTLGNPCGITLDSIEGVPLVEGKVVYDEATDHFYVGKSGYWKQIDL